MTTFTLPEGYTFEPDAGGAGVLSDIPAMQEYGGATLTEKWDATGAHFVACCARNPAGQFGFRVFREDAPEVWREIPLQPFCDGRGSITKNDYDGTLRWRAWRAGNQFEGGVVPEAHPFAPSIAPEAAVELWEADYINQAECLDGQLHIRLNKMKRALVQLRRLARARGWLG